MFLLKMSNGNSFNWLLPKRLTRNHEKAMLFTFYVLKKVRIHNKCLQKNLKYQGTDAFFSILIIWVYDKTTSYFVGQNDLKGFLIQSTLSLSLIWSPTVVIHKALRYKLTCSVDHIIGQAILICCRVKSRVGKDTIRSLKGKNTELIIQNVWNRQTLTEECEGNFLVFRVVDSRPSLRFRTGNLSF